jgi:hypothetical protein
VPVPRVTACVTLVVLGLVTLPLSLLVAVVASSAVLLAVAVDDTRADAASGEPDAPHIEADARI